MTDMKHYLVAALLAASTATAQTVTVYDVPSRWAGGGRIATVAKAVERVSNSGAHVMIRLKVCTSSCTYWLTARNVCVSPDTRFEFHGVQSIPLAMTGIPFPRHERYTRIMADDLEQRWPGLGDWFWDDASHKTGVLVETRTGRQLNREFGVPLCGGDV